MIEAAHIVNEGLYDLLDLFGPTIEFLVAPEANTAYCVMKGTIPPGSSVPLHSHPDIESFFLVSGAVQALSERNGKFDWLDVRPGQFVHVPSNAKHAWRNTSTEPAVQMIVTTPTLGKFLQEIGRPIALGTRPPAPTPNDLQRFVHIARKYNYWLGSPTENAAVGIAL